MGQGMKIVDACSQCRGEGRTRIRRKVKVRVPSGADSDTQIRYPGEGEPGSRGGPPGDLFFVIDVQPHPKLKREGDDLITEASITMVQAALGAEIEIDSADGKETVTIPHGTQPGDIITLKKKGVPHLRGGGRGNLHILCHVEIPRSLTTRQKELLKELGELSTSKKKHLFS